MKIYDLYNRFPREAGIYRKVVNSMEELLQHKYTSLYSLDGIIDKAFIDFDSPNLQEAYIDIRMATVRVNELKLPYIPIFSGRKGFHLYVLFKPWKPSNTETAKAFLRTLQNYIAGGLRTADRTVFADVRRIVRIPNTLNNTRFCVPLPSLEMSLSEVLDWATEPRDVEYYIPELPEISSIPIECHYHSEFKPLDCTTPATFKLISRLIRTCVAEVLATDPEPPHLIRLNFVAELMWLGYKESEVLKIIEELRWLDYNQKSTEYYVHHIYSRKYNPLSCSRLREIGVRCTNCGWRYWWTLMR